MALTGIEIFKLLPKTNCKKCGFPTCLAFAMKVAQGQIDIEKCPDVSEEVKIKLKESAAPPIRGILFGTKTNKLKIGEETVLFRHEKKFFNPTVLALQIKSSEPGIDNLIEEVINSEIERVGELLKIDSVFIKDDSTVDAFLDTVKKVITRADIPIILGTQNPDSAFKALEILKEHRPILYGANEENLKEMADLAKKYNIPIGVSAKGIEKIVSLIEKAKSLGVEDLVINTEPENAFALLHDNTIIRQSALKKTKKQLGYPIITFAEKYDDIYETVFASAAILKYSSIVVLSSISRWKNLVLFTLRQNIYSDPQVPMQVKQDIYKVGEPDAESPVIVTTNFALTYFLVKGEIENSKIPCWLAIMDCDGLSVLTAWAAGKFSASRIAQFIKESGIEEKLNHKELIIPGYVAMLKGAIEDKLPDWKVIVGPKEASGLPAFLKNYVKN